MKSNEYTFQTGWTPTLYQSGEQRKHALNMLDLNPVFTLFYCIQRRIESTPVCLPNPRPNSPYYYCVTNYYLEFIIIYRKNIQMMKRKKYYC